MIQHMGTQKKIARAIAEAIGGKIQCANNTTPAELKGNDLLIVGSPTQGSFPSDAVYRLLNAPLELEGVSIAAFATRTERTLFGFAAPKISKSLKKLGGTVVALPEGFVALGKEGPLMDFELERASDWATGMTAAGT